MPRLLQTLYTYPDSFRASKVLISAQYSGASIRVVSEPPAFVLGETNKTQEFLSKFPLGKVCSTVRIRLMSSHQEKGKDIHPPYPAPLPPPEFKLNTVVLFEHNFSTSPLFPLSLSITHPSQIIYIIIITKL